MRRFFFILVGMFTLVYPALHAEEIWTTREATTSIKLHAPIFKDLGITILGRDVTATALAPEKDGFAAHGESVFAFSVFEGRMGSFTSGELNHFGGYRFEFAGQRFDLQSFSIRIAAPPYTFEILDSSGARWFRLTHAHPHLMGEESQLILRHMDLELAQGFAEKIGRPDLVGQFMGTANIRFAVDVPFDAQLPGGCPPDFTGDVDVVLSSMTSLSQGTREAGGRLSLAVSASLRNDGTADVPWLRAIAPDGGVAPSEIGQHPFLVLHIYQLHNGVFSQVAQSDVKHAFFSVNSLCNCPGGQILYVGCSDTYGAGTNLNRTYLAPRDEVTAFTGDWTSLGSHFDGSPVDDFRHHGGTADHDDFEHRMVMQEPLLDQPGSRFFVEAWYLVKDDINIFNNMGYREFSGNLTGSVWSFNFISPSLVPGAVLNAWVDPNNLNPGEAHEALDTGEGRIRLAAKTTDLGNDLYRYEFALMNLDFDRQLQTFRLPLPPESIILDPSFIDRDDQASTDWEITIEEDAITWQAPAGQGLDWGTLFNFGFTANGAPGTVQAALTPVEGSPTALDLNSLGPMDPCLPEHLYASVLPEWPSQINVLNLVDRLTAICD